MLRNKILKAIKRWTKNLRERFKKRTERKTTKKALKVANISKKKLLVSHSKRKNKRNKQKFLLQSQQLTLKSLDVFYFELLVCLPFGLLIPLPNILHSFLICLINFVSQHFHFLSLSVFPLSSCLLRGSFLVRLFRFRLITLQSSSAVCLCVAMTLSWIPFAALLVTLFAALYLP